MLRYPKHIRAVARLGSHFLALRGQMFMLVRSYGFMPEQIGS